MEFQWNAWVGQKKEPQGRKHNIRYQYYSSRWAENILDRVTFGKLFEYIFFSCWDDYNFSHSDSGDSPHDRRPMSRRGPQLTYLDDFDDSTTEIPALVNRSSSESLVTRSSSESDSEYEDDQVI